MSALVALLFALAILAVVLVSRWRGRSDPEQLRRSAEERLQALERRNVRRRERQQERQP